MALYSFVARDRSGKKNSGIEEANSEQEIIERLQSRDLIVVNVVFLRQNEPIKRSYAAGKKSTKFSHHGVTSSDLTNFARQVSTMIGAGVSVLKSLEVISSQVDSARFYSIISKVCEDVRSGFSLHKAFARHTAGTRR